MAVGHCLCVRGVLRQLVEGCGRSAWVLRGEQHSRSLGRWSVYALAFLLHRGHAVHRISSTYALRSSPGKWPADADAQANHLPGQTIVRYAGDWGGQKDGPGHKHQSAHSRSSQKRSRLPHCESVGLGHGFTMDKEAEKVKDGLAP